MLDDFEGDIKKALNKLPKEFKKKLDNVNIFVEDYPTHEQSQKFHLREENKILLGLYEGIPQTKRGNYGIGAVIPDKITLFRYPLLATAQTGEHLVELIKETLYHEIGHHFGMSEEELQRAQKRI